MNSVKKGVRQTIQTCLGVTEGEKVVIIADKEAVKIARAIIWKLPRGVDIQLFVMEEEGQRPLKFPNEIAEELAQADVGFFIARDMEGELETFRGPMLEAVEANKHLRFAHMGGVTERIMKEGMCSDYGRISRLCGAVYGKVSTAREIKVTAEKGTNLVIKFSPQFKWVICDGVIKKGIWGDLPDGEVFTCPASVSGILVVDVCLGDYFDGKYGLLAKTPVGIFIEDGRVVSDSVKCANKELENELNEYLFRGDANSNRVGEFALGTNIGLKRFIGVLRQDEKVPGVHLAFGDPYPKETGADWGCDSHIDCVIQQPTVEVDGEVIMRQGKYILNKLKAGTLS